MLPRGYNFPIELTAGRLVLRDCKSDTSIFARIGEHHRYRTIMCNKQYIGKLSFINDIFVLLISGICMVARVDSRM